MSSESDDSSDEFHHIFPGIFRFAASSRILDEIRSRLNSSSSSNDGSDDLHITTDGSSEEAKESSGDDDNENQSEASESAKSNTSDSSDKSDSSSNDFRPRLFDEDDEITSVSSSSESTLDSGIEDEQDVTLWIKKCVKHRGDISLTQLTAELESTIGHSLDNIEMALVEREYVRALMDIWLRRSFVRAEKDVKNWMKDEDFDDWLEKIDDRFKCIGSLKDLAEGVDYLAPSSWTTGAHLNSIIAHEEVNSRLGNAVDSTSTIFNKFKSRCNNLLSSACAIREGSLTKGSHLIATLVDFLTAANENIERTRLLGRCAKELGDPLDMINCLMQCKSKLPQFQQLVRAKEAMDQDDWTPQLERRVKETLRKLLSPFGVRQELVEEGGRSILKFSAISLVWSEIKDSVTKKVDELHLVGLAAIHVDDDLLNSDWHGTNILITTAKLFVSGDVCWDVSGLDAKPHSSTKARNASLAGADGAAGIII